MGCAHNKNQDGFTLVEISIVMIIIGLLIGGTFGSMKLIENANVSSTVRDLKAAQAASITFRDIYGRLPGDLQNPAARLPNCTTTPCSNSGNGNRQIGADNAHPPIATSGTTDERFVFWQHLLAANLISYVKPVDDIEFGEGQPLLPVGEGLRLVFGPVGISGQTQAPRHYFTTTISNDVHPNAAGSLPGNIVEAIDRKIDDGMPNLGRMLNGWQCNTAPTNAMDAQYLAGGAGCSVMYKSGF